MYWKSSLVSWLSCTRGTCDSGHLMHAIMTEVSVEPRVLMLAELALYLLFSFMVSVGSFHPRQVSCLQDSCFSIHFVHMCISTRGSAYTYIVVWENLTSKSVVLLHSAGLKSHESVEIRIVSFFRISQASLEIWGFYILLGICHVAVLGACWREGSLFFRRY